MLRKNKRCQIAGIVIGSVLAGGAQERAAICVDVDAFDNQIVAQTHYDAPFYGPEQINALFATCASNGVTMATWRAVCQIASYPSRLNYGVHEMPRIRSSSDARRAEGAFAAKVGVAPGARPRVVALEALPFGGLVQRVDVAAPDIFEFRAALSSPPLPAVPWLARARAALGLGPRLARGAFLAVVDAADGKVLARSDEVACEEFQHVTLRVALERPCFVGVFSYGRPDIHVFVADALSLRDSAGKEWLANGGMEASDILLEPEGWQQSGANFVTLNGDFRTLDAAEKARAFPNGDSAFKILHRPHAEKLLMRSIEAGDPLACAGRAALRNGVTLYAWFDPVDDGRRTLPPVQAKSSKFLEEHPHFRCVDREGRSRWGLLCFGYPEVRAYKTAVVKELLAYEGVAGIALKLHYPHNNIWSGNRQDYTGYLYNDVALADYHARWGEPADGRYDTYKLRVIYGEYVVQWLRELRPLFAAHGKRLCLFQAPTSQLHTFCGSWVIPPEKLIEERLCEDFLIEPRHRGDSVQLVRDSERIRALLWLCRRNGVRAGFDFWLPGMPKTVEPNERGAYMYDQLIGLAQAGFDFLGVYEEIWLVKPTNIWPMLGEARRTILAAPPVEVSAPEDTPSRLRNVLALDKGGSAYETGSGQANVSVLDLIDGDDSSHSYVRFEHWPVVIELTPAQPASVNRVALKGGHLVWKNQCAPEDVKVEGQVDGTWLLLADVRDAATRRGHTNSVPLVCAFEPVTVERLRVTVTRSSDVRKRILVIREIEAYHE